MCVLIPNSWRVILFHPLLHQVLMNYPATVVHQWSTLQFPVVPGPLSVPKPVPESMIVTIQVGPILWPPHLRLLTPCHLEFFVVVFTVLRSCCDGTPCPHSCSEAASVKMGLWLEPQLGITVPYTALFCWCQTHLKSQKLSLVLSFRGIFFFPCGLHFWCIFQSWASFYKIKSNEFCCCYRSNICLLYKKKEKR